MQIIQNYNRVGLIYRAGHSKRLSILLLYLAEYLLVKNEFHNITGSYMFKVIVFSTDQGFCTVQRTVLKDVLSESRKNQYNP